MRITSVRAVVVGAVMRNWVFVEVLTDEGIRGWGEATTEWRTRSVVGAVDDFAPLLLGADPFRLEHLWRQMDRGQFWRGGMVTMSALSGIDQALHDVKAQALGIPVYELLGGRVRDELRCYDHLGGGDPSAVYGGINPEAFADAALASVDRGFTAIKFLAVPVSGGLADPESLRRTDAAMAAVRGAVGDSIDLMVDIHGRCTPAAAARYIEVLRPYDPWFIEEPCQPDQVRALPSLAALGVPLALGERLTTLAEFDQVLGTSAVAVIQPDICHAGGYRGLARIADLGVLRGASVAPHNPLGPIATAHALHFAAATPSWLIQEQMRSAVPWFDEIATHPLQLENGVAPLPAGPGLGTSVDMDVAAMHPFVPETQIGAYLPDGTVADW